MISTALDELPIEKRAGLRTTIGIGAHRRGHSGATDEAQEPAEGRCIDVRCSAFPPLQGGCFVEESRGHRAGQPPQPGNPRRRSRTIR